MISLLPRYVAKAYRFNFAPTDVDKMRVLRKRDPSRRTREELLGEHNRRYGLGRMYNSSRPSLADRRGSRTDMATGLQFVHRGFDFSQEEGGVAIQRIQTNLSERRKDVINERTGSRDAGSGADRTAFSL